jgi:hypothetical protein
MPYEVNKYHMVSDTQISQPPAGADMQISQTSAGADMQIS